MHKVLVVDDDVSFVGYLKGNLVTAGYVTIAAPDGFGGLRLAKSEKPSIVIADFDMPGMDGYEMAKQMKSDAETSHIPIIGVGCFIRSQRKILDGYVPKDSILGEDSGLDELYKAMKALLKDY